MPADLVFTGSPRRGDRGLHNGFGVRQPPGRHRLGHHADLVVLGRDPFDGPDAEIGAAKVAPTFTGGRCVHET